jgi:hypothetical protein
MSSTEWGHDAVHPSQRPKPTGPPTGPQGPSGNTELAYAESAVSTFTTSTVAQVVPGLSIQPVVGTRPIILEVQGSVQGSAAGQHVYVSIYEGATLIVEWQATDSTAFGLVNFHRTKRLTPTPGQHTYQVKVRSGTNAVNAGLAAGTTGQVSSIAAIER